MNIKKLISAGIVTKVLIILMLNFGVKLFISCSPQKQELIPIEYNHISVFGNDNSGIWMAQGNRDTLYAEAIALKITLSDTSLSYYAGSHQQNRLETLSFPTLQAWSPAIRYIAKIKVFDLKIKTLMDIDETSRAGDDVTHHFLHKRDNYKTLYRSLDQGIAVLNGIQENFDTGSIIFFLRLPVKNTKAQFEITVILDDGSELLARTEIFTILES